MKSQEAYWVLAVIEELEKRASDQELPGWLQAEIESAKAVLNQDIKGWRP